MSISRTLAACLLITAAADAAKDCKNDDADDRPLLAAVVVGPLCQQRTVERVSGRRNQVDDHKAADAARYIGCHLRKIGL